MEGAQRRWILEARISKDEEWRAIGSQWADVMRAHEAAREHITKHGGGARVKDSASGQIAGQFQSYGLRTRLAKNRRRPRP